MMNNVLTSAVSDLVLGIDHVALAVEDIEASISWYTNTLGFSLVECNEVSGEHSGMVYAVLTSGATTIVLVQGTSPVSQVARFIEAKGTGMHHIALAVSDLDETIRRVGKSGGVADTPIVTDQGIRQAFLQRDPVTGVRIELIERHGGAFSEQNVQALFKALEAKNLY
jgi:methylmalonyl-CoA epimerase